MSQRQKRRDRVLMVLLKLAQRFREEQNGRPAPGKGSLGAEPDAQPREHAEPLSDEQQEGEE